MGEGGRERKGRERERQKELGRKGNEEGEECKEGERERE